MPDGARVVSFDRTSRTRPNDEYPQYSTGRPGMPIVPQNVESRERPPMPRNAGSTPSTASGNSGTGEKAAGDLRKDEDV